MAWKEQMTAVAVPGESLALEGVWQASPFRGAQRAGERSIGPAERGAVIAPPHPLYGGSLDHPVCNELAYGLHRAGWASLRFNWRGVGASQGAASGDLRLAECDYRAALEHVAATVAPPVLAAGYSFGAATAARVALLDARVGTLLLVAPPAAMLAELPLERFAGALHVLVGERDEFAPRARVAEALAGAARVRLEVIPGADHFFSSGGLAELAQLVETAAASSP